MKNMKNSHPIAEAEEGRGEYVSRGRRRRSCGIPHQHPVSSVFFRRLSFPSVLAIELVIVLCLFGVVNGLRNVRLSVPTAIKRGSSTVIVCHYDLEGDSLYSVKWYKGRREFFRFTPKEDPSIKIFPIHGLHVDQKRSNASQVVLRHVTPAISGRYSCEVSADAPSFHTALVSGDMDVVDVPKGRPSITGVKPRYRVGEILAGNCSSPASRPPANLTWLVNGHTPNPAYVTHYPHVPVDTEEWEPEENRRMSSRLGLRFEVGSRHFEGGGSGASGGVGGKLKIRCTANIHSLYWQITEKSVEEDRAKLAPGNPLAVEEGGVRTGINYYGGGGSVSVRGGGSHFDGVVVEEEDSVDVESEDLGEEEFVLPEEGRRRQAIEERVHQHHSGAGGEGYHEGRQAVYHGTDGGNRRRHQYDESSSPASKNANSGSIGPPLAAAKAALLAFIGVFVSIR